MENKLNHSDLSALLAKDTNISLAKAEQFTKAMFDLIIEGLEQDGIVKINGLGTFRIADVASRSSVNVNTGEKFEIKGHRKLVFIPADTLKDDVNQPFSMFEPVEVDESYKDDEPEEKSDTELPGAEIEREPARTAAIEIEEEIPAESDIYASVCTENENIEEEMPVAEDETVKTAMMSANKGISADSNIMDDSCPTDEEDDVYQEEENGQAEEDGDVVEEALEETPETNTGEESGEVPADSVEESTTRNDGNDVPESSLQRPFTAEIQTKENIAETSSPVKKDVPRWGVYIFSLIAIPLLLAGAYCILNGNQSIEEPADSAAAEKEAVAQECVAVEEPDSVAVNTLPAAEPVNEEPYRFIATEKFQSLDIAKVSVADTVYYRATGELARHKVMPGDRLTKISLEYYGDKRLWPYIVSYNRLDNPNGIAEGMELSIPMLHPVE